MKRFRFVAGALAFVAAASMSFGAAKPAAAQSFKFSSGVQVQNLSGSKANISIAFYKTGASDFLISIPATIEPNDKVTYVTLPSQVEAGFDGSAVISSDQRVAAIVNIVSPDEKIAFGAGSYVGVSEGSPSVNLPLVKKNHFKFNSFFNVQNVGSTPAQVTVTYSNGFKTPAATIQPGAALRYDAGAEAGLGSVFFGSAIVEATGSDIAAVVTEVGPTTMLVYNGIPTGVNNPVFPLVNVQPRNGLETGIAVQNTGTADTNVTITYTPSSTEGTACTETKTVAAKSTGFFAIDSFSATRNPPAGTTTDCKDKNGGKTFVGSARVTTNSASQPLVGIVNQLNQRTNKGASYSAFGDASATDTVVFPLIQDRVFNYFTGLSLVNVGTVPTTITCSYSGTPITQASETVNPGGSFTLQQINKIAASYNGTGTCKASAAGAKIVGIANYVRTTGTNDSFTVYEGTNTTSTP